MLRLQCDCMATEDDRTLVAGKVGNVGIFGALPRPFVDGLMQFSPSRIPIVRAINTAPLISMSGDVRAAPGNPPLGVMPMQRLGTISRFYSRCIVIDRSGSATGSMDNSPGGFFLH